MKNTNFMGRMALCLLIFFAFSSTKAQTDWDYFQSLHNYADAKMYLERAYTDILVPPLDINTFNSIRSTVPGDTFIDPDFGREWTLVYDGLGKVNNAERKAWNEDGSLFVLQSSNKFYVFDGSSLAHIKTVNFPAESGNCEGVYRWVPGDSQTLWMVCDNQIRSFDILTETAGVLETFDAASFTFTGGKLAGGDGNDADENGDMLFGNFSGKAHPTTTCFVYNFPLQKVVRIQGGVKTYLDPSQAFSTFTLNPIDYAVAHDGYVISMFESGGTDLLDVNGAKILDIYRRTPHMDPNFFEDTSGNLYPGFVLRYNNADASQYNGALNPGDGIVSESGHTYFHGWDPNNPSQLVRFEMSAWPQNTELQYSGGQVSYNREAGTTGIMTQHGPEDIDGSSSSITWDFYNDPWEARMGECYEVAMHAEGAGVDRRFAHHHIGYDYDYQASYQPEGWLSPDGEFAVVKVKYLYGANSSKSTDYALYKIQLGQRTPLAVVDAILADTSTTPPVSTCTELIYDDFENGFGNWTDGGGECYLYTGGTFAHQGNNAVGLQDDKGAGSSFYLTNALDLATPNYTALEVSFWYMAVSMDAGEDFWVQYSEDDGATWTTVETFVAPNDFDNDVFYQHTTTIEKGPYNFTQQAKIRFVCDASGGLDDVYFDEVRLCAVSPPSYTLTLHTVGNGSVTNTPGGTSFVEGSLVDITALPDAGWEFTGWTGDLVDASPTVAVTLNADMDITANFIETCTQLVYEDFENGFVNWTDGGGNCYLYTGGTFAHQGNNAAGIEDDKGSSSSFYLSNSLDLTSYNSLEVSFWFMAVSMDAGEDFWVQFSDDGGSNWATVEALTTPADFQNDTFYQHTTIINSSSFGFSNDVKIRFVCDASGGLDDVYIDEISICGKQGTGGNLRESPVSNTLSKTKASHEITAYPNPFQEKVVFNLALSETSKVDVNIYSLDGNILGQAFSHQLEAGEHRISWSAPSTLRAGVYLVKASIGNEVRYLKIRLIR